MTVREHVQLSAYTTFHIGGPATSFVEARTEEEIDGAIAFARNKKIPLFVLGGGSNVLVPDAGISGVVLRVASDSIAFQEKGGDTLLIADAGASWDAVVDAVGARGIYGIENLAGIPGTVGGAAVQNIGAYGAELTSVFAYADVIEKNTGRRARLTQEDAAFAYRTSVFKRKSSYVIIRVALRLQKEAQSNVSYPDLARAREAGESLSTPQEISRVVRAIRAKKFPQGGEEGTAGSFFKNPILPREFAAELAERFPGLPVFAQGNGMAKISLAWILDHVLALKGYVQGHARVYEAQPLVIVTRPGAHATEVDALALEIALRVREATGIVIEREVETFGENFSS